MVSKAIDAFVRRDLALAQEVMAMDDIVDGLFDDCLLYTSITPRLRLPSSE